MRGPPYRPGKSNLVSDGGVIFSFVRAPPPMTLRERVEECGISPRASRGGKLKVVERSSDWSLDPRWVACLKKETGGRGGGGQVLKKDSRICCQAVLDGG